MKKKIASLLIACVLGTAFLAGCKSSSDSGSRVKNRSADKNEVAAEVTNESVANAGELSDDLDLSYEAKEGDAVPVANTGTVDSVADAKKEMLVFRCTIALDTLNFEESVTSLKTKIAEYHGFVERENQSDGNDSTGRYVLDEEDKDYYYTATIRIPSEYYESFVSAASGIGTLRSKNSSVDNVATRYGTLKSDLEIYEAEYDRYLKQYNETEDETIALQIQRELRDLAITISDIKTEMSILESDVAYSYVTITIHKVSEKEIVEKVEEEEEEDNSFGARLSRTAKGSWNKLLGFLQGIVLFFVASWWVILLLLILIGLVVFFTKRGIQKSNEKAEARSIALEAQQRERLAAYEAARQRANAENQARAAENQAQIQARIAAQRAAEQAQAQAVASQVEVPQAEAPKAEEPSVEDPDTPSEEKTE